mmetsp:Transcript_8096/g.22554  ORF Transcript_8096/g.22554 Transcript_8096/m.22554 type:complete len:264 (-) Transcript_8096:104-895(-)
MRASRPRPRTPSNSKRPKGSSVILLASTTRVSVQTSAFGRPMQITSLTNSPVTSPVPNWIDSCSRDWTLGGIGVPSCSMSRAVSEAMRLYRRCFVQVTLSQPMLGRIRCPEPVSNTTVNVWRFGLPAWISPKYEVLYAMTFPFLEMGTYCFRSGTVTACEGAEASLAAAAAFARTATFPCSSANSSLSCSAALAVCAVGTGTVVADASAGATGCASAATTARPGTTKASKKTSACRPKVPPRDKDATEMAWNVEAGIPCNQAG